MLFSCQRTEHGSIFHDLHLDVNPFIGTGGHGHTFPGPILPFGMIQPSPDTRLDGWDGCSGYHYSDSIIHGFSHTHLSGTGVSDYGDVLFMPTHENNLENSIATDYIQSYSSLFKKDSEAAHAGYYSVTLEKGNIKAELTSGLRTAFHRYSFNKNNDAKIIVDLKHRDKLLSGGFRWVNNFKIEGSRISKAWADSQAVHFAAKFSHKIISVSNSLGIINVDSDIVLTDENGVFILNFGKIEKPLQIAVSISGVDRKGAAKNLFEESKDFEFDDKQRAAEKIWNEQLGKIEIDEEGVNKRKIFYTSLYHSFTAPYLFTDVDGRYRGMDGLTHQDKSNDRYTVFSLWDTYRAAHPLFTILEQKRSDHFINSLLGQYNEGGILPIWELGGNYTGCMIGYHAIPAIVDAYVKGIRGYDEKLALKAMIHSADLNWRGLKSYKAKTYVTVEEESESLSKTLEYAYDDWCIAQMALSLKEQNIHDRFIKRSLYYQSLYDEKSRFFRPKFNGGFVTPFDPYEVNFHLTEANSWQYSMYVPHDLKKLASMHGGVDSLSAFLDEVFSAKSETTGRNQADITGLIGQYAHGNEPSHHMAYLYAYTNEHYKTPVILDSIMSSLYSNKPNGLSGNEDCGQMSAWYVFSALGFYPVCPGSNYYVVGKPLQSSRINLENGNSFIINCINKGKYIKAIKLNGMLRTDLFILHEEIINGGEIEMEFTDDKNESVFYPEKLLKYSSVLNKNFTATPIFKSDGKTFTDSLKIELTSLSDSIYYRLCDEEYGLYTSPFYLGETSEINAYSITNNIRSAIETARYNRRDNNLSVQLRSSYADQYSGGGNNAIIDGLKGSENFRTGIWQGYQGQDFEAIIDLGENRDLNSMTIGFLQDAKSWIMLPNKVEVYVDDDSDEFQKVKEVTHQIDPRNEEALVKRFTLDLNVTSVTRIKIKAEYFGRLPKWHLGAGGESWLFIDEVEIN